MQVGQLVVGGFVTRPPRTPTRKVRDFGFTGGNPSETSSVHVSHDEMTVSCSVTETPGSTNSRMYVSVGIDGAELRIYRSGRVLTVLCTEGDMKISTGLAKPSIEIVP